MSNSIHLTIESKKADDGSTYTDIQTPWGTLSSAPTTAQDLESVDVFLFSRELREGSVWRGQVIHLLGDELFIEFEGITYGPWKLFDERIEWSDGPPHPDKLQLAVRSG